MIRELVNLIEDDHAPVRPHFECGRGGENRLAGADGLSPEPVLRL
jgi:hypothetical protein